MNYLGQVDTGVQAPLGQEQKKKIGSVVDREMGIVVGNCVKCGLMLMESKDGGDSVGLYKQGPGYQCPRCGRIQ